MAEVPSRAQTLELMRRRRTARAHEAEAVPPDALAALLEADRWAPSAAKRQPWEVIVVRDPEVKKKMGEWGANPAPPAAAVFLIVSASGAAAFDEGRLAERLNLAALAHGLASSVATLKGDGIAAAREFFGIPADRRSHTVVTIGHPDQEVRRARPANPQPRKPMDQFAHWDRF